MPDGLLCTVEHDKSSYRRNSSANSSLPPSRKDGCRNLEITTRNKANFRKASLWLHLSCEGAHEYSVCVCLREGSQMSNNSTENYHRRHVQCCSGSCLAPDTENFDVLVQNSVFERCWDLTPSRGTPSMQSLLPMRWVSTPWLWSIRLPKSLRPPGQELPTCCTHAEGRTILEAVLL